MIEDVFFAWQGANHPDGPWRQLRVLELRGTEAISELFHFELELAAHPGAPEVDLDDLVGSAAALRFATSTTPASRIVHGVVASAEELDDVSEGMRLRITLVPPLVRSAMMKKSCVYLEKTLEQIVEQVLRRTSLGAALVPSESGTLEDDGDLGSYAVPQQTFVWRIHDDRRLRDAEARPYCVQYDEPDFLFVSRLLEEEGVSYHFEHGARECRLVLTDHDGGRPRLPADEPLGPGLLGRHIDRWRTGRRLRPRSVHLDDYNWRKPNLDLRAQSPSGVTDFTDIQHPGRYEHSADTGRVLAEKREQRLDSERIYATASGRCRFLGAGTIFTLEHPKAGVGGDYLVTSIRHVATQRGSFVANPSAGPSLPEEPYRCDWEALRCGSEDKPGESRFRPARRAPRPHVYGTQTAVVTADPSSPDAEINVGGPENVGCVRVRFKWDMDDTRCEKEPSSCFVRVSQFFAGSDHGALWHPRVGDEVIVEYLDGDPDRPIVTGRVYNGIRTPPGDPEGRPTYSAIKSLTVPYNGNYNLIAFDDAQGEEQIVIHAARDFITNVERGSNRSVGQHDDIHVVGNQTIKVDGHQTTDVGSFVQINSGANISMTAATDVTANAGVNVSLTAGAQIDAQAPTIVAKAGGFAHVDAPVVWCTASGVFVAYGGAGAVVHSGAQVIVNAPNVTITGGTINVQGGTVEVAAGGVARVTGGTTEVIGQGQVTVKGGTVDVEGGTVNVKGGGAVNVTAGSVNLNC